MNALCRRVGLLLLGVLWIPGCRKESKASTLSVSSPSFAAGAEIPAKFTCDGANISPALSWAAPPTGTQSVAIFVDDPDALLGFTHWILFNLPATVHELPEGIPQQQQLENGALQGENGFDKTGYGGPCPPGGSPHHYVFHVYALDTKVNLPAGTGAKALKHAMGGHILAQGQLIGLYRHPR